jgi:hypothetical protein
VLAGRAFGALAGYPTTRLSRRLSVTPTLTAVFIAMRQNGPSHAAVAILEVKTRYTFWEADVFGEQGAELK